MNTTVNLSLPYILPSQAQKAVTHNEALRRLDALVMLAVKSKHLSAPPIDPEEGDRYIVADGGSADWSGQDKRIAAFQEGGWTYLEPREGWIAWCVTDENLLCFSGGSWSPTNALNLENVPQLGVNAVADPFNRITVASHATLLSHDGSDHRLVVNKAAQANTASIVFQDGYSGRAEIGLNGNNQLSVKVSPDGAVFTDAIKIDPETGKADFPANNLLESFALNLYPDAGRFSAGAAGDVTVGAFSWPAYLKLNNGSGVSGLGKLFITTPTTAAAAERCNQT